MVESWRIIKTKHAAQAFDGEGARRYGDAGNLRAGALCILRRLFPWQF